MFFAFPVKLSFSELLSFAFVRQMTDSASARIVTSHKHPFSKVFGPSPSAVRHESQVCYEQWCSGKNLFGGTPSFPSLPLEVGPLFEARGSGGALKLPHSGSGRSPSTKRNLLHFQLKSRHLVATILVIFLTIN